MPKLIKYHEPLTDEQREEHLEDMEVTLETFTNGLGVIQHINNNSDADINTDGIQDTIDELERIIKGSKETEY